MFHSKFGEKSGCDRYYKSGGFAVVAKIMTHLRDCLGVFPFIGGLGYDKCAHSFSRATLRGTNLVNQFLRAEGEMARQFRAFDWTKTPLGPTETWDPSLKTSVGLMLRSAFPQFITWGPERIFLFNDAYLPVMGTEKSKNALGRRFEDLWSDIWTDLLPIVEKVERGESAYFEDLPLYMNRSGFFEQTYFTFSYSPILNGAGEVAGLFCSCVETTNRLKSERDARESAARLDAVISTLTEGVVFLSPEGKLIRVNDEAVRQHGYSTHAEMTKSLNDFRSDIVIEDLNGHKLDVRDWPASRLLRGERFSTAEYVLHNLKSGKRWVGSYGSSPMFDDKGQLELGVLTVRDVTEQKRAQQEIVETHKRGREDLYKIIMQAPAAVAILKGPDLVFEVANERYLQMVGKGDFVIGKSLQDALPELELETKVALKNIYLTGTPFIQNEFPATLHGSARKTKLGYFNFVMEQLRDVNGNPEGIVIFAYEVTDQVLAKRAALELTESLKQSEKRLQQIIETIPQGIWRTNPDGSADYFSEGFYELVGYSPDEFLGWGWSDLIHPDDKPRVLKEFQQSREKGEPISVDFRIKRKDGSYRWYLSLGNPFFDENGVLANYYGTWTDINEERSARVELQMKSDALENSLNGFDIIDADGKFVYANRAYLKMWGYESVDEVIGTSPVDHCANPEVPMKIISALREKGECNIEFLAKRKDGSTFDVNMWARLAYDSNGREIYPSTSIDITERKRIESTLRAAKEEAERANELKSAFLANMSHEIRTPLGAMIGFADLLRDPGLSRTEHSNYIDILARNGEQLAIIINDILDLSKVEAGHMTLEYVDTSPDRIAADVISLLRVKAKEKDLALEYYSDPSTPSEVVSDPVRVRQVLLNLVSNAVKFTQFGSVKVRSYGIEGENGERCVAFEITDTGIGIPTGKQDSIFEMFVQADGSMTRRFGGTGLGLALSRRLARTLGGDVKVTESEEGKGTTFKFTFADQPDKREEQAPSVQKAEFEIPLSDTILKDARILVVDDAPDNQQLLWRYLTKRGAIVESAENGYEGYKKALAGNFDAVLMDIQMPLMDGYTATQKLREQGYAKPIIALTAHAMSEVRKKCLNVGCSDHLTKPINSKELVSTVARHLQRTH